MTARISGYLANRRVENTLLRQVIANVFAVMVFIIGFYIALRVSGLTRLAVTLLGGTGLVGLALGFAFRDIAENYLSSILISINHPFRVGDLIEVDGAKGFVRKVTTRGTVLNTLEGNQIQIPNSTVYKSKILNFTATPLLRLTFAVGIGFEDAISDAQELIMQTLLKHEAVIKDPAPLVLVDALGAATVNLKTYYWIDQSTHSGLKVSSSVIRQVKETLAEAGVSMPDEARELVFPHGVPARMIEDSNAPIAKPEEVSSPKAQVISNRSKDKTMTQGEGNLSNEQDEVMRVTGGDATIAGGENLIE
ncbi:mechanosensitive ion channel family protein [Neorhodopirellula pilleata]|uniref:Small-conductance mechanosensitive channel n=1 Tax=Neorhodopirellula pilleata TaxID=2714738 RepID=A0A5C6A6T1_9BACT|nr:mechanosensitive ion channel domain-containing protein [Neorhodopirellula pilleata]TWT95594.1 Small-conductance mechanosensitive channel [Neorhodopirellula pilleata]